MERELLEMYKLNLVTVGDDSRYSMKDSNFFYHFRAFFHKAHRKRLRVYYLRGLHYYLDYTIKFIQVCLFKLKVLLLRKVIMTC